MQLKASWSWCLIAALFLTLQTAHALTIDAQAKSITPEGLALASLIDSLDVVNKWAKGIHVSWFGGLLNNPNATDGISTHCSAYAAAVAERLGIPMLRPPLHSQILLASDQHKWFEVHGASVGWRITTTLLELQAAANLGMFAVISKESLDSTVPGHIALVRPHASANTTLTNSISQGPQIAQSGGTNYNNATARQGFGSSTPLNASNILYAIYDRQVEIPALPAVHWKATNKAKTIYLVDQAPAGRLDVYRLEWSSSQPIWRLASAAGMGVSNTSAWAAWYVFKLSNTTRGEPFTSTRSSYATFFPTTTGFSVKDGTSTISTTAETGTGPVAGITGMWYATVDRFMYGVFITKSNATNVGGYALLYGTTGAAEFHVLELTWSTVGSLASGVSKRCTWGNSYTCINSGTVTLSINGVTGTVSGLPVNVPATGLAKATVMKPFLGPVPVV